MEKSLPATKRKIDKAKKEGNVAKSPILTSSCILLWCCLSLLVLNRFPWLRLHFLLPLEVDDFHATNAIFLALVGVVITVVLGGAAVMGCCSELLQSGGVWRTCINISRINAFDGVKHLKQAPFKFFTVLLYLTVFLIAALLLVVTTLPILLFNSNTSAQISLINLTILKMTGIFFAIAVLDWLLQRQRHLSKLKMSFNEMKREIREEEGDFHIKAQRRALQEQMVYEEIVKRVRACRFIVVESRC